MTVPLLNNSLRSEKPWLLMIFGILIAVTFALAISSCVFDGFKTTKTGELSLLSGEVTTIDDVINDVRSACSLIRLG